MKPTYRYSAPQRAFLGFARDGAQILPTPRQMPTVRALVGFDMLRESSPGMFTITDEGRTLADALFAPKPFRKEWHENVCRGRETQRARREGSPKGIR